MPLEIKTFVLGPIENNTYLLFDPTSKDALIIDPSFDIDAVTGFMQDFDLSLSQIWLTHAHFDHFYGIFDLRKNFPDVKISLHPADLFLWEQGGLGSIYNLKLDITFPPDILLNEDHQLFFGSYLFKVFHTPGHSPGHVSFYNASSGCAFVGDLIFKENIGRTDLPGGSTDTILQSIRQKILPLPPDTILYPGHGPATSVKEEIRNNPYI